MHHSLPTLKYHAHYPWANAPFSKLTLFPCVVARTNGNSFVVCHNLSVVNGRDWTPKTKKITSQKLPSWMTFQYLITQTRPTKKCTPSFVEGNHQNRPYRCFLNRTEWLNHPYQTKSLLRAFTTTHLQERSTNWSQMANYSPVPTESCTEIISNSSGILLITILYDNRSIWARPQPHNRSL